MNSSSGEVQPTNIRKEEPSKIEYRIVNTVGLGAAFAMADNLGARNAASGHAWPRPIEVMAAASWLRSVPEWQPGETFVLVRQPGLEIRSLRG